MAQTQDPAKTTVAIVGGGPSGLSMLKQLWHDGFDVTLFDERSQLIDAHFDGPQATKANLSKFTCGFSDYPIPDKYPLYLTQAQFHEFLEGYATDFDLHRNVELNTRVVRVARNENDTKWVLDLLRGPQKTPESIEVDKVVLCNGYTTRAAWPTLEGRDSFQGEVLHAQQFRNAADFAGKNVLVLGFGSSTGDVVPAIAPHASKIYLSHRRGVALFKRLPDGRTPSELVITRSKRHMISKLQVWAPRLAIWLANMGIQKVMRQSWEKDGGLDPAWRLTPPPCPLFTSPSLTEDVVPLLRSGKVTSTHDMKRFTGPRRVEFEDGTVVDDIDAVICCTGYEADFSIIPWLEGSMPADYGGKPIKRLYMNVFPPKYPASVAILNYHMFGKTNGFSFNDVISMGISNIWRGRSSPLPSAAEMERSIDENQKWVASRWRISPYGNPGAVKQWDWQSFFNRAAGTAMENLGWGWRGWWFWLRDRKMSTLMNHGVDTGFAYRYFVSEKREAWEGAREAIIKTNEAARKCGVKSD